MALALNDVMEKKSSLDFKNQAFINGNYTNSVTGKTFESISPVDGSIITSVSECDVEDINIAVKAARDVLRKGHGLEWLLQKEKKFSLISLT